jgi:hypothetical protein
MARELLEEIDRQHDTGEVNSETLDEALVIHRNLIRSHRLYAYLTSRAISTHSRIQT